MTPTIKHKPNFKLQFDDSEIRYWADRYELNDMEREIESAIVPKIQRHGFVDYETFLRICYWKSQRTKRHCLKNSPELVHEATRIALSDRPEPIRIGILTMLQGVSWPTASVFLHWFHKDRYPLLDFRALESLGVLRRPAQYDFDYWWAYVEYCREIAENAKVNMRTLDRALWQYSKETTDSHEEPAVHSPNE